MPLKWIVIKSHRTAKRDSEIWRVKRPYAYFYTFCWFQKNDKSKNNSFSNKINWDLFFLKRTNFEKTQQLKFTLKTLVHIHARKELLSRINWIYYWRSFCRTRECYNYLQLIKFNKINTKLQKIIKRSKLD
jgi:hypothetical protein